MITRYVEALPLTGEMAALAVRGVSRLRLSTAISYSDSLKRQFVGSGDPDAPLNDE